MFKLDNVNQNVCELECVSEEENDEREGVVEKSREDGA